MASHFIEPQDAEKPIGLHFSPPGAPLKRLHSEITYPNLCDHNVRTAGGLDPVDFFSSAEQISQKILDSLEFLQTFVSSNDPLLVNLAQLPQAQAIIQTFNTHTRNKKNEFIRKQQVGFQAYKYFPPRLDSRRAESPTPEATLPPILPYYFATPDVHVPHYLHKPQPPSFTFQNQISLPEGELVSNVTNLGIDWCKTVMKDFDLLGELGNGAFGTVRLCREKATGKLFCVKILDRNKIRFLKQREHILNERTIMFKVNHPFIVKLFCTFKSPSCLFFLMEFVAGGELFNFIRAEGQFTNETTKQVAAEIILALQYLHNQDIIYRDIKPENLLVDHHGHLKLTDFGFAKHIDDRTNSMCGTLDYMAPEILMAKGHGKGADWWSLGILIYEMLSGCPPLSIDAGNGNHAMHLITSGKLEYPPYFDKEAVDLIQKLLVVDEKERIGSRGDAEEIKRHPWFANVKWSSIIQRESPGPLAHLKSFKLHTGTPASSAVHLHGGVNKNDFHGDINLRDEMAKAGPASREMTKSSSFDGFEGFRGDKR